jgi:hypothetical protein
MPGLTRPSIAVRLAGAVLYTNAAPLTTFWKSYSGSSAVDFADPAQTNTIATFDTPGVYTLMLGASNGIHTVAYDAIVFTVIDAIRISIARNGANALLRWTGGVAPFTVETVPTVPSSNWTTVATLATNLVSVPLTNVSAFYRVRGQ